MTVLTRRESSPVRPMPPSMPSATRLCAPHTTPQLLPLTLMFQGRECVERCVWVVLFQKAGKGLRGEGVKGAGVRGPEKEEREGSLIVPGRGGAYRRSTACRSPTSRIVPARPVGQDSTSVPDSA
eukprot:2541069-Rhodomonas_salina.2